MRKEKQINIEFDRATIGVVLRTFSSMKEHYFDPKIIDWTQLQIDQCEIEEMIEKLIALKDSESGPTIIVPMNFRDWVVYSGLISGSDRALPLIQNDLIVLEELYQKNINLNEREDFPWQ